MSDSVVFENRLDEMRLALDAWGRFIVERITELVELELGSANFKAFFKIKPEYRCKDKTSALKKLSKKKYTDPSSQMTDLVGARFVVLLKSDIDVVERVVIAHTAWSRSRDRNPEDEQERDPTSFAYQSVHYLLRNTEEFTFAGVRIPEGLCCEVQIRTLLQHAYAELGHDRIYKGEHVPISVHRLVARSMALMETTDEMFVAAVRELDQVNRQRDQWCSFLDETMKPIVEFPLETKADADALEVLDTFKQQLTSASLDSVRAELNAVITARIQHRAAAGESLFRKPVVLAVYWLVRNFPFEVEPVWPIPSLRSGLATVKSDLGIA